VKTQTKRSLAAIVVVVLLVGLAFAVNRLTAKSDPALARSSLLLSRANLDRCPTTSASGAAKGGLPSLTLPCLGNGPSVNVAKLRGPLVVNVWAGPCPPCKAEAPLIQKFYAAARGKVGVLGVVDGDYPDTVNDALDASHGLGLHYPSLFDLHGKLVTWARAPGIPFTVFVRADGTIANTHLGQLAQGQLASLVKQYLGVDVGA
jgi:cytochrome c biogenesis protein CcmG, thiol:disulfide interchange protein DsbE